MKECYHCGVLKPVTEFSINRRCRDLLQTFHDYYLKPRLVRYGCFLQESEVA